MQEEIFFADVKFEFENSLGYIRRDITWLCEHDSGLCYRLALLIGTACEALADGGAGASKEDIFAKILPIRPWQSLKKELFDAVRNGLSHGFDTKNVHVGEQVVQIYMDWNRESIIGVNRSARSIYIGVQPMAKKTVALIDDFESTLRSDAYARRKFRAAAQRGRTVACSRDRWLKILDQNS